jgi:hypothetical protein
MNEMPNTRPSGIPGRDIYNEPPPRRQLPEDIAPSASEGALSPSEARERVDTDELCRRLIGVDVKDYEGAKIGTVARVYYRELRGVPEWVAVKTGLVDSEVRFAPLEGATIEDDIQIIYPKAMVDSSPDIEHEPPELPLELALYRHYNMRRITPGSETELAIDSDSLKAWAG